MSLNRTPGPWKALGARVISDYRPTERYNIADCDNHKPYVTDDIGEANARLIAAAPELLAALKNIDNAHCGKPLMCGHDYDCTCVMEMARNAIKKAEGV